MYAIKGLYASELPSCVVTGLPVHKRDLVQVCELIRQYVGTGRDGTGGLNRTEPFALNMISPENISYYNVYRAGLNA